MVHDVSNTLQEQIDLDNLIYTEIYTVTITGLEDPLYLTPTPPTSSGSTVAFSLGGQDFTSFAITRSEVKSSSDTSVDSISVRFQNVDQSMGAIVLDNDIRGADVTISGLTLVSGTYEPVSEDAADFRHIFHGNIGAIKIDEEFVQIQLNFPIKDIRKDAPRRFYGPPEFPFAIPR